MTKFELYERLWQDICHKDLFISEKTYTEKEYQLHKQLFQDNFFIATMVFSALTKELKE